MCDKVIERVKTCYSQKHAIYGIVDEEKWSEKFIQGTLIKQSLDFHLDSEFAYNDVTDKLRDAENSLESTLQPRGLPYGMHS